MKTKFTLEIVIYQNDNPEQYIELIKKFDLPFIPAPGIFLKFTPVEYDKKYYDEYIFIMKYSEELADNCFLVDSVIYNIDSDELRIRSYYSTTNYRNDNKEIDENILPYHIQQLIIKYGFIKKEY